MKILCFHILMLSVLAAHITAGACSCIRPDAKGSLKYADVAFRGELIEHRGNRAVFRVDEWWKGNLGPLIEFEWRDGTHGDCDGFWPKLLQVGSKLQVFGKRNHRGYYSAHICLPQKFLNDAETDLKELGPGTLPSKD